MGASIINAIMELIAHGHRVVIVYPIPMPGWHVPNRLRKISRDDPRKLAKLLTSGGLTTSYDVYQERVAPVYDLFGQIPDGPNLVRVYPEKLFCNGAVQGRCVTHDDKQLFFIDTNHLSLPAAAMLVDEVMSRAQGGR